VSSCGFQVGGGGKTCLELGLVGQIAKRDRQAPMTKAMKKARMRKRHTDTLPVRGRVGLRYRDASEKNVSGVS
jgi:hypothetical protein